MATNCESRQFEEQDPTALDWSDVADGAMQPMPADADCIGDDGEQGQ